MTDAAQQLEQRHESERPLLLELSEAMIAAMVKAGFDDTTPQVPVDIARKELRRDPYDGTDALYGEWYSPEGRRLGNVQVRADGNLYAEFDIVQPHPTDKRWFVESVTAWGSKGAVKTELKLLPSLES